MSMKKKLFILCSLLFLLNVNAQDTCSVYWALPPNIIGVKLDSNKKFEIFSLNPKYAAYPYGAVSEDTLPSSIIWSNGNYLNCGNTIRMYDPKRHMTTYWLKEQNGEVLHFQKRELLFSFKEIPRKIYDGNNRTISTTLGQLLEQKTIYYLFVVSHRCKNDNEMKKVRICIWKDGVKIAERGFDGTEIPGGEIDE